MAKDLSEAPVPMRSKRPLVWLAVVSIAPFVASLALYFWLQPTTQMNYGTLLPERTLPAVALNTLSGEARNATLRGKWTLLIVDAAACAASCERKLYATRQARTMQGKERERVARVWVVDGGGIPSATLVAAHPDLTIATAEPALIAALPPDARSAIYLVDPLGNLILRYPEDPDIKRLNRDLARLLYASRIG